MPKIQGKIFVFAFSLVIFSSLLLNTSAPVSAASLDYSHSNRTGKKAFNGAIGFTLSPDTFIVAPGIDFYLTNGFSIGPSVEFGFSDRILLFTGTAMFKYMFDFDSDDFMRRFKPVVEGGGGLTFVNSNPPGNDNSNFDIGAIFNFGFGFDIFLTDSISLGNHLHLNFLTPNIGDRFMLSWQFVVFKYFF